MRVKRAEGDTGRAWPAAAWLIAGALCTVACTVGCAGLKRAARPDARLAIVCSVPLARVYLDDRFVGLAGELGALPVVGGDRRVELRADGYFTAYRDVKVPPAGRARLEVELHPVPEGDPGGG
jgi:hypothetical protein